MLLQAFQNNGSAGGLWCRVAAAPYMYVCDVTITAASAEPFKRETARGKAAGRSHHVASRCQPRATRGTGGLGKRKLTTRRWGATGGKERCQPPMAPLACVRTFTAATTMGGSGLSVCARTVERLGAMVGGKRQRRKEEESRKQNNRDGGRMGKRDIQKATGGVGTPGACAQEKRWWRCRLCLVACVGCRSKARPTVAVHGNVWR